MKIYIASHSQFEACAVADDLRRAGHKITARWLDKAFEKTASHSEKERWRIANENFDDVRRSDALVLIAGRDKYSGGKFVEMGYAHALGKHVLILGRRENVQCYGNHMKQVRTRVELVAALTSNVEVIDGKGANGVA